MLRVIVHGAVPQCAAWICLPRLCLFEGSRRLNQLLHMICNSCNAGTRTYVFKGYVISFVPSL